MSWQDKIAQGLQRRRDAAAYRTRQVNEGRMGAGYSQASGNISTSPVMTI